jgi:hypothetical protein
MLLLCGCGNQFPTPAGPFEKVTIQSARALSSERVEGFKNKLKITLNIDESTTDYQLNIEFEGTSSPPFVFKQPRRIGLVSTNSYGESDFTDLKIYLTDDHGNPINDLLPSSQFAFVPRARNLNESYQLHQQEDFIVLQAGDTYRYFFSFKKPAVRLGNEKTYHQLPTGEYLIYVVYCNDYIGYQVVEDESARTLDDFLKEDSLIYDLNAWVGEIVSDKIEVSVK